MVDRTLAAMLGEAFVAAAVMAQPADWESLWERGLDEADRHLSAFGYEIDRDAFRRIPNAFELGEFLSGVEERLDAGSLEDLAWIRPEVEAATSWLEGFPEMQPYVSRLRQILDYLFVAEVALGGPPRELPTPQPRPKTPPLLRLPEPPRRLDEATRRQAEQRARSPEIWRARLAGRKPPPRAAEVVPSLKKIFEQEGLPAALVWIAEVESGFDPRARSPAGAVGLFQFMPVTARRFGLNTDPPDDRFHPARSAKAAAAYLRELHRRFGSWPLAVAGYNAGEGRVLKALRARNGATGFDEIADLLPLETQMYVPKVRAVIDLREGLDLVNLPGPRPKSAHPRNGI